MKAILMIIFSMSTYLSYADTSAFENFWYQGGEVEETFTLHTEKTKTEYRTERVLRTCYRTEWETRCHRTPPRCDNNGNCRRGRRVCRQYSYQVPYSCYRYETVAYQVHDYDVETNVKLKISEGQTSTIAPNEKITVKVTGRRAKINVSGSGNYFIYLNDTNTSESRQQGVLYKDIEYVLSLDSALAPKNVNAYGIQNMQLQDGVLSFSVKEDFNFDDFTLNIRVYTYRRVLRDILFKNELLNSSNTIEVSNSNGISNYEVNLKDLGVRFPARLRVILDIKYKLNTNGLLNKNQVDLDSSVNWVFR